MRGIPSFRLFAACACLWSCGEQPLQCGTDAVTGTLSSIVRDRVLRVAADAYPASYDPTKRAALTKATRVTPRTTKLIEWDTTTGRLACVASIVIEAPGPEIDTNRRSETELRYRVSRDAVDTFIVEVAYADMMTLFPTQSRREDKARAAP